jgi:hypothetical protein
VQILQEKQVRKRIVEKVIFHSLKELKSMRIEVKCGASRTRWKVLKVDRVPEMEKGTKGKTLVILNS